MDAKASAAYRAQSDVIGDAITVLENMRVTTKPMEPHEMGDIEQRRLTVLGYLREIRLVLVEVNLMEALNTLLARGERLERLQAARAALEGCAVSCPECGSDGEHGLGCPNGPTPMAGESMRMPRDAMPPDEVRWP